MIDIYLCMRKYMYKVSQIKLTTINKLHKIGLKN